jgi:hypothetical protein
VTDPAFAFVGLTEGLEVALPPDPPEHVMRLMGTLGVTVLVDESLPRPFQWDRAFMEPGGPTREQLDRARPVGGVASPPVEAAAALHRMDEGLDQRPLVLPPLGERTLCRQKDGRCENTALWTRGKFAYHCESCAKASGWRGKAPKPVVPSTAIDVDDPLLRAELKLAEARKKYHAAEKHLDRQRQRASKYVAAVKAAHDACEGQRQNLARAVQELANEIELLEPPRR